MSLPNSGLPESVTTLYSQVMDWASDSRRTTSVPAVQTRKRRPNWRAIFIALTLLIVVAALVVWWLGRGDDDGSTPAVAASEPEDLPDDDASAEDDADDADADDESTGAEADGESEGFSTPGVTTLTTVPISTTTFTVEAPENAEDFGPSTLNARSTVSTVGLDEVTFGLTVAAAQEAAGTALVSVTSGSGCYHVVPTDAPEGIVFLVHAGTIERVDINSGPITTRSGVGIGTPEETVVDLFGDSLLRSQRPDGTVDLIFVPRDEADAKFRVVFNIHEGKVRAYKSGRFPQVLTPTGCETLEDG